MMEKAVISERFAEQIAGRKVLAALFTTYTFEPDFFELEVIPLMLGQDMAYSADERVKRFMVRENLREANLSIDVFYDLPMYRMSGQCSPEMEYLCHGVNLGNRAFHGKVNLILVQHPDTEEQSLLVGAGSNNLTRAGWWDNIECQHWEEVVNGSSQRKFINLLKEDLAFLSSKKAFTSTSMPSALDRIAEYLEACKGSNSAEAVFYYGLSYPDQRRSFFEFLQESSSPLSQYGNWALEIISPFFADDAHNEEHQAFLDMGVTDIRLLLPLDSEGSALCQDTYYAHIQQTPHVRWAHWREDVARALGLTGDYYRALHAKIYHFFNKKQSWVFVGSVNFTYKALHENVEAGFLARLDRAESLLEPYPESAEVDKFADLSEKVPGIDSPDQSETELPELHLCYDWINKRLTGRTSPRQRYEIEILGPEGDAVISPWSVRYQEAAYEGNTDRLEIALKNGSLINVKGYRQGPSEHSAFPVHAVLLQQVGWSHKPLDLPDLTATQILAIYAGMSPERRQLMMIDAKIRALVLASQGGELTTQTDEQWVDQFFSEYAEIFNAFSKLKSRLMQAQDDERYNELDYYLTGTGVDSLPSLMARVLDSAEDATRLNAVTSYLLLLSALEIYRQDAFKKRPNVGDAQRYIDGQIEHLKKSDRLKLENNTQRNRKKFFAWYEQEFFRVYRVVKDRTA